MARPAAAIRMPACFFLITSRPSSMPRATRCTCATTSVARDVGRRPRRAACAPDAARAAARWRRTGASAPTMPAWTRNGLTGWNRPRRTPSSTIGAERLRARRATSRRMAASTCAPPSAISRNQIGGKCGRASASAAMASTNGGPCLLAACGRARRRRRPARPTAWNMSREDLAVERGLAAEVVVDHRLVEAGGGGDAVDAGAGEAVGGELAAGGGEDPVARPIRRPPARPSASRSPPSRPCD